MNEHIAGVIAAESTVYAALEALNFALACIEVPTRAEENLGREVGASLHALYRLHNTLIEAMTDNHLATAAR